MEEFTVPYTFMHSDETLLLKAGIEEEVLNVLNLSSLLVGLFYVGTLGLVGHHYSNSVIW